MPDAKAGERFSLSVLGPLEIRKGDRLLPIPARKDRALLGVLALSRGRTASRVRLAGLLWGDSSQARARDSLKQALRRLRRLGGEPAEGLIVTDRESVGLAPMVQVDAEALFRPVDDAAAAAVLALRRGPFLDGLEVGDAGFRDWLLAERAGLDRAYAEIARHLMGRAEAAGRSAALVTLARQQLSADPWNEEAVRSLMRAHVARGQRRLALQVFEEARTRIASGLDLEPEPETVELARQIRDLRAGRESVAEVPDADLRSIAVLPFATIGGDPANAYFADGLTEDIITDLGKVEGIRVVARSAAFALKGRSLGAADAARILGVSHVLQGSVRPEAGAVRVTARLVAAEASQQIWASRFDRPMTDIFLLQDDLARNVVAALRGALATPDYLPSGRGTQNVEAYRLYLKARSFYLRGLDRHSLVTARLLLMQAIDRDPRYAAAYALLATCEFYTSMRLTAVTRADPRACAELARKAISLDPDLAEARAALGLAHYAEGRYAEAERELASAGRLDADLFEPPFFLARSHRLRGERAEAARLYARAAQLRPEDYRACGLLAEELQALGRSEEMRAALEQAAARLDAAVERHPDNTDALAFGAAVHAELGNLDRAREWCRWALVIGDDENLVQFNYNLARTYALLGEAAAALARLARLVEAPRTVRIRLDAWLASDLAFDALRRQPGFAALLDRLRDTGG
ncbi:hypothetical protein LHP98_00570 [Rhodobacter sp. Har01]|uniref:BTAD domain-containing putative transcriptional regulator n=1 Tax=Rhodobacter sp. Har01 TaxID=2883999 RepID=UPI001D07C127|nr:BTAD domain-containing putative transcriptional regulator [Rhodobacter sp. Har01]MCB6176623.1 hypothetical protein [Rhodobacter sp. Har01]